MLRREFEELYEGVVVRKPPWVGDDIIEVLKKHWGTLSEQITTAVGNHHSTPQAGGRGGQPAFGPRLRAAKEAVDNIDRAVRDALHRARGGGGRGGGEKAKMGEGVPLPPGSVTDFEELRRVFRELAALISGRQAVGGGGGAGRHHE